MQSLHNNIYKIARKTAGLTQNEAAELLNVSVRSLADYETGKTIPPDDIVIAMVEVYRARWLAYGHLKNSTLIGQKFLPDLTMNDLPRAVLKLKKEMGDIERMDNEIIDVACDGKVDKKERLIWDKIVKEINDVISAAFGIVFSKDAA